MRDLSQRATIKRSPLSTCPLNYSTIGIDRVLPSMRYPIASGISILRSCTINRHRQNISALRTANNSLLLPFAVTCPFDIALTLYELVNITVCILLLLYLTHRYPFRRLVPASKKKEITISLTLPLLNFSLGACNFETFCRRAPTAERSERALPQLRAFAPIHLINAAQVSCVSGWHIIILPESPGIWKVTPKKFHSPYANAAQV